MTIRWIEQFDKRNCGQIAVAVLSGKPLAEIEKIVGHDHGTRTKDLSRALSECDLSAPRRRKASRQWPSKRWIGIAHTRAKDKKTGGHWIVIHRGKVYDGCAMRVMTIEDYKSEIDNHGWKLTALLPVW